LELEDIPPAAGDLDALREVEPGAEVQRVAGTDFAPAVESRAVVAPGRGIDGEARGVLPATRDVRAGDGRGVARVVDATSILPRLIRARGIPLGEVPRLVVGRPQIGRHAVPAGCAVGALQAEQIRRGRRPGDG